MKNIFIISGPSGSGHDSVIVGLSERMPIERVITTTTRSMRPGETEGHPYYFIGQDAFENGIANSEFAEYARTYNDAYYGVTRSELERATATGRPVIWKVDAQGTHTIKQRFPEIPAILITAPLEVLRARIVRRDNPDADFLESRMRYTKKWYRDTTIYDYVIENKEGALEESVEELYRIIQKLQSDRS